MQPSSWRVIRKERFMTTQSKKTEPVGFKHPPKEHQFRPGQSGNPAGRPKGVRSFGLDLRAVLAELTPQGNGDLVTKQLALTKNLVTKALAGDERAIAMIVAFLIRTSGEDAQGEEAEAPEDREIMNAVSASPGKRRSKTSSTDNSSNQG
jgi:hypothetical protein